MIVAADIRKKFADVEVLRGIDLTVRPHAVTTIVGPSGAGKTTLLQILGTLTLPEPGGRVLYDGTDVTALPDSRLSAFRNKNIGFIFQFHQLLPEFTIAENVALPAMIAGTPRRQALEKARGLLAGLGLEQRLDHRPDQLSGGECQRAAVARALINNPAVVLADEPSGSLDSENRARLHKLFFELRDTMGATFVIVTHDESLSKDSDCVVRMADGRIIDITEKTKQ